MCIGTRSGRIDDKEEEGVVRRRGTSADGRTKEDKQIDKSNKGRTRKEGTNISFGIGQKYSYFKIGSVKDLIQENLMMKEKMYIQ